MSDAKPDRREGVPRADEDWAAWRKYWEDAGVVVPARNPGAAVDWDALRFLPFTEEEVTRMFLRLRRTGRL